MAWGAKLLTTGMMLFVLLAAPLPAAAQTVSVSRTVTITAKVANKRSIIINNQGQIIKIYSNTAMNVEPQVYVNEAWQEERPLTEELKLHYQAIIEDQENLVGVEIPVEPPRGNGESVQKLLFNKVSAIFIKF